MKKFPDTLIVKKSGVTGTGADIQTAIDKALKSKRYCIVYIPCGRWILDEPLRLYPSPPAFDIQTDLSLGLQLTGARPAYGAQGGDRSFTVLECTFSNAPAIDIQASRGTTVANLALEGQNKTLNQRLESGFSQLHRDDIWLDPGVTEEHVAIAIDSHAGKGSGSLLINYVSARFFGGGISIGTSGSSITKNGESIVINRFSGFYLGKAGVFIGHDQTKAIKLNDCFFHGQQYWIDCVSKGQRRGIAPVMNGCLIGATQRLFNIHHAFGYFACHGLYVESTLSLGTIGWGASPQNLPAVFTGCEFVLYQQESTVAIDTHLMANRPVLFQGCTIQFNRDHQNEPQDKIYVASLRTHNSQQVVFDTCTFAWKSQNETPPLVFALENHVEFRSCSFQSDWWKPLSGKPTYEFLALGALNLSQDSEGDISFILDSNMEIQLGDFIGFPPDGPFWTPKSHVPDLPVDLPKTQLPFATVGERISLPNGKIKIVLHQVAHTIHDQLSLPQTWPIFRWRVQVG